jgi:hypothetical protein
MPAQKKSLDTDLTRGTLLGVLELVGIKQEDFRLVAQDKSKLLVGFLKKLAGFRKRVEYREPN